MRRRVQRHIALARHLADRAEKHPRLELLDTPQLSICCFRYRRDELTEAQLDAVNTQIVQTLRAEENLVPSTARIEGRLAIRPCIVNPAATLAEVDALADRVVDIGDRV
jgi:glutamate/tyrosine decarboxylase-like PLP-dependent enzyme